MIYKVIIFIRIWRGKCHPSKEANNSAKLKATNPAEDINFQKINKRTFTSNLAEVFSFRLSTESTLFSSIVIRPFESPTHIR